MIELAIKIALNAHHEQPNRRDGAPFILHPLYIMSQMNYEDTRVLGVLHDVIEDTDWTKEDLISSGISTKIANGVQVLSRDKGTSYLDYICDIKDFNNSAITKVKLADLKHNMDLSRCKNLTKKDIKRESKYQLSYLFLTDNITKKQYKELMKENDNR